VNKRWKFMSTLVIGRQQSPMIKRVRLIQTPWFGVYIHFIYREDLDRDLHDHPWKFWRMVLKGGYHEAYNPNPESPWKVRSQTHLPFRPTFFPTDHSHRITWVKPGTVTLVLVGRKTRTWGFWVPVDGEYPYHGIVPTAVAMQAEWESYSQYATREGVDTW